jgi:hypothetical protein
MCAFAIRESGIRRVVYALKSPVMGGLSKWNILADDELSRVMPGFFSRPPTIIGGVLAREAEEVWSQAHPMLWTAIKRRGCFVCESPVDTSSPARSSAYVRVAEFIRNRLLERWRVASRNDARLIYPTPKPPAPFLRDQTADNPLTPP